jgi:TolA-binding protein
MLRLLSRCHRGLPRCAWLALAVLLTGCQSGGVSAFTRWRMANDKALASGPSQDETLSDRGLMDRWLTKKRTPNSHPNAEPALVLGPNGYNVSRVPPDPVADAEFKAALKLFQQGKLPEAEAAFAKIAKKRKETPWGEKAQFYLAETQFQRGKFVAANDSLVQLFTTYPGIPQARRDKAVRREWEIAQAWLALSNPSIKSDHKIPWYGRFTGQRPLVDTNGHAMQVLEHVRHHDPDPNAPLADDATMQIADYHFSVGDYESAAHYYDELITLYPKSPLKQRAEFASIDAKMKGYIGPDYDGAGLKQATETVYRILSESPDHNVVNIEALTHTLDLVADQEAERAFRRAEWYRKTGHVLSAEYYFAMVPYRWPKSEWAKKAKVELAALAKMPRKLAQPSKIMTRPGSTDPLMGGVGSGGLMGLGGLAGGPNTSIGGPAGGAGSY